MFTFFELLSYRSKAKNNVSAHLNLKCLKSRRGNGRDRARFFQRTAWYGNCWLSACLHKWDKGKRPPGLPFETTSSQRQRRCNRSRRPEHVHANKAPPPFFIRTTIRAFSGYLSKVKRRHFALTCMLQQHHGLLEWYTVKHPPAMGYKTVVFIQLSLALAAICHDSPNNRSSIVSPLHIFKSWIHHALPTEKTFWKKTLRNQALESFSKDLTSQTNSVNTETPEIVSSIKDSSDEDQDLSNFNQLFLTSFRSGCACQPSANGSCSTKCTSQESRCGRTCFHLTEYSASQIVQPARLDDENDFNVYSTYQTTLSSGCELLTRACIMTTALAAAAAAAAAVGVGVAIGVGVPMNGQALSNAVQQQQQAQVSQDVQRFLSSGGLFNSGIPRNDQPIPVRGASLSDGGCSDNLVLFPDGKCYPVLRRGPCGDPFRWVTVDPTSLTVNCTAFQHMQITC